MTVGSRRRWPTSSAVDYWTRPAQQSTSSPSPTEQKRALGSGNSLCEGPERIRSSQSNMQVLANECDLEILASRIVDDGARSESGQRQRQFFAYYGIGFIYSVKTRQTTLHAAARKASVNRYRAGTNMPNERTALASETQVRVKIKMPPTARLRISTNHALVVSAPMHHKVVPLKYK